MKNFSDFNIKPKTHQFVGEKIQVQKLFNLPIQVLDYKVEPSKQKKGTELLTLQIIKGTEKRIVFTGSTVLIDQIKRVPEDGFPFNTIIRGDNDYYEFT
ncbi:MAG: hypothetical protein O9302_00245 [Cyclobacteriaceae bacterium]|nr:hypothetical protein [Cytophagales bacterium]MCZ8326460.1 hypothetical protein [Cyclobacteriaceae bacterium]